MNFIPAAGLSGAHQGGRIQPRIQIKSMKETKQYKQMQKDMVLENMRLLKRLQDKKPTYTVEQWSRDRVHIEKVLDLRSKFSRTE